MEQPSRFVVICDRDGVINVNHDDFVKSIAELEMIPGSDHAIAHLTQMGALVIVVTNQSGIDRGTFTETDLALVNGYIMGWVAAKGGTIARIYHCPHDKFRRCDCRKPAPGLIEQAIRDFGFDPTKAFVIGDREADIALGEAVGATTILVLTGHGKEVQTSGRIAANHVAWDLLDASSMIRELVETREMSLEKETV